MFGSVPLDSNPTMAGANILVILSGSIACYKACDAISQLVQRGHRVRAVATKAALRFVGVATLEGLTREKVAHDLFEDGAALDHVTLARWAEVVVVCPATANMLNRMAAGLGEDLAGALLLAHDWKKPLVIAPAMNPTMWTHPATLASVTRLREWGARFVSIGVGRTACGEEGEGRLAEPAAIVAAIEAATSRPTRRLRVLITSGGTSEPIDGVRVLTNTSTGDTGARIAEHFSRVGHDVVLLRARNARRPEASCREEVFSTFSELDTALSRVLGEGHFDAVIHAAAVGDFSIHAIEIGSATRPPGTAKLSSDVSPTLRLRRNPKLLDSLRARSRNPSVRIVAFKLTHGAGPDESAAAVLALLESGAADFVVHNDLAARSETDGRFPAEIWRADGSIVEKCSDRAELALALENVLTTSDATGHDFAVAQALAGIAPRP
jgi:phosphopantothenoylcysteine decarboxylase/phosphopantothenate--cysteine ligase